MKNLVVALILMLFSTFVFAQSDCELFKTGKFQCIENGIVKTTFERDESFQIEKSGEKIIKLKIEWLDDCTYLLIFLEGNDAWWEARGRNRPTNDLIVRIIDVNGNSYSQEAKFMNEDEFKYKSIIRKIE
jgi:hypothetical protein